MIKHMLIAIIAIGTLSSQGTNPTAKKFVDLCASCHTIGDPNSNLDGPDLTEALTYSDADLMDALIRMNEEQLEKPLSADEQKEFIAFFRMTDATDLFKNALAAADESFADTLKPGDMEIGRRLYLGLDNLENQGMACVSCHSSPDAFAFSGGWLGPSLADTKDKFGRAPLFNGIKNARYNVMKPVYESRPITAQEAFHILTYLNSEINTEKNSYDDSKLFIILGLIITVMFYGLMQIYYNQRHRSRKF